MQGEVEGPFAHDVAKDHIPLLAFHSKDLKKLRTIFTDTNRYAKSTTAGMNRMLDERDLCAIVSRGLLTRDYINVSDVNFKSNTLNAGDPRFTTLATIYEVNMFLMKPPVGTFEWATNIRKGDEEIKKAFAYIEPLWKRFLSFKPFKEFLSAPKDSPGRIKKRCALRTDTSYKWSFLYKPAAQVAFLKALGEMHRRNKLAEAISRAEDPKMDWSYDNSIWRDIMVKRDKTIDASKTIKDFTANLIVYMLNADDMNKDEIDKTTKKYNELKGHTDNKEKLPDPLGLRS